jgi:ElaA protein
MSAALTAPGELRWRFCAFGELSVHELQAINSARQQVFSLEQQCVYLDADGCDERSHHLAAWAAGRREPLAYARVVAPGVKYAEPSIGRVISATAVRGTGLGRELVRRAIACCREIHPHEGIRISAQSRLEAFYAGYGFAVVGERYMEDGIPHTEMLLPPARPGAQRAFG